MARAIQKKKIMKKNMRRQSKRQSASKKQAPAPRPLGMSERAFSNIKYQIEKAVFSSKQPLSQEQLAEQLSVDAAVVVKALWALKKEHAKSKSALIFVKDSAGWQFAILERRAALKKSTPDTTAVLAEGAVLTSEVAHYAAGQREDENHAVYKEFLDEINDKLAAIAHHPHNAQGNIQAEIEDLMHTVEAQITEEAARKD